MCVCSGLSGFGSKSIDLSHCTAEEISQLGSLLSSWLVEIYSLAHSENVVIYNKELITEMCASLMILVRNGHKLSSEAKTCLVKFYQKLKKDCELRSKDNSLRKAAAGYVFFRVKN